MGNNEKKKKTLNNKEKIEKLVGIALLTAIVVVFQLLGSFIKFGTFSVSLVLIPIVVGSALYGVFAGGWLGFIFGVTVLLSGDAALFLNIDPFGTFVTVLLKGTLAGICAALVFKVFAKKHKYVGVVSSALVCPLVNTGVFAAGCFIFFFDAIKEMALAQGADSAVAFVFLGMIGLNFVFEVIVNIILAPVIFRVVNLIKKK